MASDDLSVWDNLLLAFTTFAPERYQFVTHDEVKKERHAAFLADHSRLTAELFSARLHRLLNVLPILYTSSWPVFAATGSGLVLFSIFVARERLLGIIAVVGFVVVRVHLQWLVRRQLAAPWSWREALAGLSVAGA